MDRDGGSRDDVASHELLATLKFGADAIVRAEGSGTLSDADLDLIIDRTRPADVTVGCLVVSEGSEVLGRVALP